MDNYQITFNTWNKLAAIYEEKFMDFDIYNSSYDKFCERLKKEHPKLLEIGCGPGNITKYLLNKRPDLSILGTDIAPTMIEAAQKNNPSATFKVLDAREIDRLEGKFDAVLCGFCMPYLSEEDCKKLISDSYSLLNEGGIAYFSTIEGDLANSSFQTGSSGDQSYVYYHSEENLSSFSVAAGFEIVEIIRVGYEKSNGESEIHLIYILEKQNRAF